MAAGTGRETSLPLPCHHEKFQVFKGRNVDDGWYPADDPAASRPMYTGGIVSGSNAIAVQHLPVHLIMS